MEVANVSKLYKKFKAVDNVSLTINKSEFLTILGPSGSGKTSLLKLIAGFEKLSAGNILLDQEDVSKKKVHERNIGMVFQNYALFPNMTVYENVAYPLRLRKILKSKIDQLVKNALSMVQLTHLASRNPSQLSGGQQQRVALARAMVFSPSLLLLDEPLSALDKNLREQMQLEIKHIQENSGITTISVTHDQKEALTMSDRICVMNKGRIEQLDTPENIYKHPKNRFVAEFIGEINLISGRFVGTQAGNSLLKIAENQVLAVKTDKKIKKNGTSALIVVRPENIQIAREKGEFQNSLKAKPIEIIYLGEGIRVQMMTDIGIELEVKIPSVQASSVSIGKELYIGWNADEATLIDEDTSDESRLQMSS